MKILELCEEVMFDAIDIVRRPAVVGQVSLYGIGVGSHFLFEEVDLVETVDSKREM